MNNYVVLNIYQHKTRVENVQTIIIFLLLFKLLEKNIMKYIKQYREGYVIKVIKED